MIELPQNPQRPAQIEHEAKRDITSPKESEIVQALEHGWATTGARLVSWSGTYRTSATSWTGVNDYSGNTHLYQLNTTISPQRAEVGALGPDAYIVEVQAYLVNAELQVEFYERDGTNRVSSSPAATATITGGNYEWSRAYVLLSSSDHLLKFSARSPDGSYVYIRQIAVNEIKHVNVPYDRRPGLLAYGSEWVGQYADGDPVPSVDADGALAGFTRSGTSYQPLMARDAVAPGVHGLDFEGSHSMSASVNPDGLDGIVFSTLINQANATGNFMPWSKQTSGGNTEWYDYWAGSTIGPRGVDFRDTAASTTASFNCTASRPPTSEWIDYTWLWSASRQQMEIYFNGTLQATTDTGSNDELASSLGNLWWGAYYTGTSYYWQGMLAMPCVIAGDLPMRDLQRLFQWRRSMHGIY